MTFHSSGGTEAPPSLHDRARLLRSLAQRLRDVQKNLRILDAIAWDEGIEHDFFAAGAMRQPAVTRTTYARRPLSFDPDQRSRAIDTLEGELATLSPEEPAAALLLSRCRQCRGIIELLKARGTASFADHAKQLYAETSLPILDDSDLVQRLEQLAASVEDDPEEPLIKAQDAACFLGELLGEYFGTDCAIHVRVCDGLLADASAGSRCLKLRRDAQFSMRQLRLLEVHEGWVHLATTLNGLAQGVCPFLGRPCPAATSTQEGLAVLLELLMGVSSRSRLLELARRIEAVNLAQGGATFLDVYQHLLEREMSPRESYHLAARVFRGSLPEAGPFCKDLSYGRGLWQVACFARQRPDDLPLLFCGKLSLDEWPALARLREEGLLTPPRHLPPITYDVLPTGLLAFTA